MINRLLLPTWSPRVSAKALYEAAQYKTEELAKCVALGAIIAAVPALACDQAQLDLAIEGEPGYQSRVAEEGAYCEGFVRRQVTHDGVFSLTVSSAVVAANFPEVKKAATPQEAEHWSVCWPQIDGIDTVRIAARHTSDDVFYSLDNPNFTVPADRQDDPRCRFSWSTAVMAAAPFEQLDWRRLRVDVSAQIDDQRVHLPVILNDGGLPGAPLSPQVYVQLLATDRATVLSASIGPDDEEARRVELDPRQIPAELRRGRIATLRIVPGVFSGTVIELRVRYRLEGHANIETGRFNLYLPTTAYLTGRQ